MDLVTITIAVAGVVLVTIVVGGADGVWFKTVVAVVGAVAGGVVVATAVAGAGAGAVVMNRRRRDIAYREHVLTCVGAVVGLLLLLLDVGFWQ